MNFLAPGAFTLGLLLPVIIAFYLLKLRRKEQPVPSTYLWRRVVRDVEANAPWQKLKPNLLLILQLLFLLALILAVTRPFTWSSGISGSAAIFVFDTSSSMNATDIAPSRIEAAKERAAQLVDELPDSARVTIIAAGDDARVLLSSSLDRRQAHLAIQQIRAGIGGSEMNIALELASAIAARQPGTEIVVLSDGRVDLPQQITLKAGLRYLPFGLSGENQAISQLSLSANAGGSLDAFVQVSNFGEQAATRRLLLYADTVLINAFDLQAIPASGQKRVIAEGLPQGTRVVEARLSDSDILALDDIAYAVQPAVQPVTVRLVSNGNRYLPIALKLLTGVELTEQAGSGQPVDADTPAPAAPSSVDTPDIWIYNQTVPDVLPPGGSMVFIDPPRSTDLFTVTGMQETPVLRIIDPADPLVSSVSLAQTSLRDAVQIALPAWATPVVAGDLPDGNIPLLFRGEPGGRKVIVMALTMDTLRSDLPLQLAFPVLWANIIHWLAPDAGSLVAPQAAPAQQVTFRAPAASASGETVDAVVTLPDGSSTTLQMQENGFVFAGTQQTGVYRIQFPGSEQQDALFAVNAYSPQEAILKPSASLPATLAADQPAGAGSDLAAREWWRPLTFLALGLLTGEWLVYQRAALARLRDRLRGFWKPQPPRRAKRIGAVPGTRER